MAATNSPPTGVGRHGLPVEAAEQRKTPSARSVLGLEGLNFLMAEVRDGVGPYLSVFLKGAQHWQSGKIGMAMAASSIAAAVCQIPAGLLVDGLKAKWPRVLSEASGQYAGYQWLFYLVCVFAMASAAVVRLIDPADIDHDAARGGDGAKHSGEPTPIGALLKRRDLLIFLASVVLFHFGNAAMLPMAGQVLAQKHPKADTLSLSACIIAAQLVIFGIVAIVIASDLMRGTGRFNLAQGLTALSVGTGAGLSNLVAGFIVQHYGYRAGFLSLAVIACCAENGTCDEKGEAGA